MIILEGPDGGGKSTLLDVLGKRYGWATRHSGGPILDHANYLYRYNSLMLSPNQVILDRCMFISEAVYAPIFGRELPPTFHQRATHFFYHRRPLVIWCYPPPGTPMPEQKNPLFDTPEYVAKLETRRDEIHKAYSSLMSVMSGDTPHVYRYDIVTEEITGVCDEHVRMMPR